jgi:hypothetical protein
LPAFYQQLSEARNYTTITVEGRSKLAGEVSIAGKQILGSAEPVSSATG